MSAVVPDRATSQPKLSPGTVSAPASCAVCDHVAPERRNSKPAPALAPTPGAPASTVPPETATEKPRKSPVALEACVKIACCAHRVPDRWYTYAAPTSPNGSPGNAPRFGAPTTAVSPSRATENP